MTRDIRPSAERWTSLRQLLLQIERLAQAALVMDLRETTPTQRLMQAAMFEQELQTVRRQVSRELSRLTSEGLDSELVERKHQDDAARKRK